MRSPVLGSSAFVETLQQEVAQGQPQRRVVPLPLLVQRVGATVGLDAAVLQRPSRRRAVARARAGLVWVAVLGQSGRALATALGCCPQAVYQAIPRGAREAAT